MINHRYIVLKRLGEGGSGEVFLVEDTTEPGRQAAMKVLRAPAQPADQPDEQFRNEVGALTALRHPNLVRIFDVGTVRSTDIPSLSRRRFYTMEYLEGADALEWCRALASPEERVRHIRHILSQILAVLAAVHRRGIVHFDIKPGNFLLTPSGEPGGLPIVRLTDFGFSVAHNVALDLPVRGTLEYAAPELFKREPFDHRVDLYSLGVSLYQLVEGRCPFEASNPVDLVRIALTSEPDFTREGVLHDSFLPLMEALLAKDPARRPPDADAAYRLLHQAVETPDSVMVQCPPAFVGRVRERNLLETVLERLRDAADTTVHEVNVVEGVEGTGKTALLREIAWDARIRDLPVLQIARGGTGMPFSDILPAVLLLRCELMARQHLKSAVMGSFHDALSAATGSAARDKTALKLSRLIVECSVHFPLVILADDCEQIDPDSLEVIRLVASDPAPGRRLLVCAAGAGTLQGFPETHILLGELSAEEVRSACASVLAPVELAEAVGERVHRLFGGVPAIVADVLRVLAQPLGSAGTVDAARAGPIADELVGRLPPTIEQLLLRRYQALSRECRLSLEILACVEHPVRRDVIGAALPFSRERTAHILALLEAEGFLLTAEGGRRVALRHAKLRSLLHDAVEAPVEVHAFLAGVMSRPEAECTLQDQEEIALQFAWSGDPAHAASWYERAGDTAAGVGASQRAAVLYDNAGRCSAEAKLPAFPGAGAKLVDALYEAGQYTECIARAERLLSAPDTPADLTPGLQRCAGLAHARLGNYRRAQECLTGALNGTAEDGVRISLELELAGTEIGLGDFSAAEKLCADLLDRALRLGDDGILGTLYTQRGIASFYQENYEPSIEWFRKAMEVHAVALRNDRVADALMNIGNVLSASGDTADAIRHWQDALTMSREYGTLNQQAQLRNNLGIAYYTLRRFAEAKEHYAEARALFTRVGSHEGLAYVLTNLGEVCFAEGEYEEALHLWTDASDRYAAMEDARGQVDSLLQIAQVCHVLGDVPGMTARLGSAASLISDRGIDACAGELEFQRGNLHLMLNDPAAACRCFEAARESGSGGVDRSRRLLIRQGECLGDREPERAVDLLHRAIAPGTGSLSATITAEAMLVLGVIAREHPGVEAEPPVALLARGFEAIAGEPVSELTWKLAHALGEEFRTRGNRVRSREFFTKAGLVLRYLLGRFSTPGLRAQYLGSGGRAQALADIDNELAS
jgi:tetratricopeptide (TPR) repeat protein